MCCCDYYPAVVAVQLDALRIEAGEADVLATDTWNGSTRSRGNADHLQLVPADRPVPRPNKLCESGQQRVECLA